MKVWLSRSLRNRSIHGAMLLAAALFMTGCATNSPFSFLGPKGAKLAESEIPMSPESTSQAEASQGSTMRASAESSAPQSINPTQRLRVAPATSTAGPTQATLASSAQPAGARGPVLRTLGQRESLDQIVQASPGVVLIDFYADWCGPCKKQGQILHQLEGTAAQHGATIVKVNVDEHPDLQKQFRVSSLPTLLVLKDGQLVQRQKGLTNADQLTQWLAQ